MDIPPPPPSHHPPSGKKAAKGKHGQRTPAGLSSLQEPWISSSPVSGMFEPIQVVHDSEPEPEPAKPDLPSTREKARNPDIYAGFVLKPADPDRQGATRWADAYYELMDDKSQAQLTEMVRKGSKTPEKTLNGDKMKGFKCEKVKAVLTAQNQQLSQTDVNHEWQLALIEPITDTMKRGKTNLVPFTSEIRVILKRMPKHGPTAPKVERKNSFIRPNPQQPTKSAAPQPKQAKDKAKKKGKPFGATGVEHPEAAKFYHDLEQPFVILDEDEPAISSPGAMPFANPHATVLPDPVAPDRKEKTRSKAKGKTKAEKKKEPSPPLAEVVSSDSETPEVFDDNDTVKHSTPASSISGRAKVHRKYSSTRAEHGSQSYGRPIPGKRSQHPSLDDLLPAERIDAAIRARDYLDEQPEWHLPRHGNIEERHGREEALRDSKLYDRRPSRGSHQHPRGSSPINKDERERLYKREVEQMKTLHAHELQIKERDVKIAHIEGQLAGMALTESRTRPPDSRHPLQHGGESYFDRPVSRRRPPMSCDSYDHGYPADYGYDYDDPHDYDYEHGSDFEYDYNYDDFYYDEAMPMSGPMPGPGSRPMAAPFPAMRPRSTPRPMSGPMLGPMPRPRGYSRRYSRPYY